MQFQSVDSTYILSDGVRRIILNVFRLKHLNWWYYFAKLCAFGEITFGIIMCWTSWQSVYSHASHRLYRLHEHCKNQDYHGQIIIIDESQEGIGQWCHPCHLHHLDEIQQISSFVYGWKYLNSWNRLVVGLSTSHQLETGKWKLMIHDNMDSILDSWSVICYRKG